MSGSEWYKRVEEENNFKFPTSKDVDNDKFENLKVREWVDKRDEFIMDMNGGKLPSSEKAIFLIEAKEMTSGAFPPFDYPVVVNRYIKLPAFLMS